jgi:hypothetical protein
MWNRNDWVKNGKENEEWNWKKGREKKLAISSNPTIFLFRRTLIKHHHTLKANEMETVEKFFSYLFRKREK